MRKLSLPVPLPYFRKFYRVYATQNLLLGGKTKCQKVNAAVKQTSYTLK